MGDRITEQADIYSYGVVLWVRPCDSFPDQALARPARCTLVLVTLMQHATGLALLHGGPRRLMLTDWLSVHAWALDADLCWQELVTAEQPRRGQLRALK